MVSKADREINFMTEVLTRKASYVLDGEEESLPHERGQRFVQVGPQLATRNGLCRVKLDKAELFTRLPDFAAATSILIFSRNELEMTTKGFL